MKMHTIIQRGRSIMVPIAALLMSFAGCRRYDLASLDLDAAIAQPTLVTPTAQTGTFRTLAWISRPSERSRMGNATHNAHYAPNALWRLPDFQGGGYIEVELPAMTFIGIGGQISSRNKTISDMFEGRIGFREDYSRFTTRTSLGAFVGRLRADAVYELRKTLSSEIKGFAETHGIHITRGYFADGVISGIPSDEHTVPFFAIAFVRQDLFSFTTGYTSSGDPIEEIQTMYFYSVTPGVEVPLTNGTKLTIAVRFISDITLSGTNPGIFLLPLVQMSTEF